MVRLLSIFVALAAGAVVLLIGIVVLVPLVFAGRVLPGVLIGGNNLTGISFNSLPSVLREYSVNTSQRVIKLTLRGRMMEYRLSALGVGLKEEEMAAAIRRKSAIDIVRGDRVVRPLAAIDSKILIARIEQDFATDVNEPVNASLRLNSSGKWELVKNKPGEAVDIAGLTRGIELFVSQEKWGGTIALAVAPQAAAVQDEEVEGAQRYADQLQINGFSLSYGEQTFAMKPYTVSRMLVFVEQVDPENFGNHILGVKFDSTQLLEYLEKTIAPEVNREAVNARFEMAGEEEENRVKQFAMPQSGQQLDMANTVSAIAASLARRKVSASLAVNVVEPEVAGLDDITELGVTTLLAAGESDFAGSPNNRRHNITVGVDKYHGLLIPSQAEFSFNNFLGPVTAAAGFKPELVIKNNVTTPEFGGGLCQVSTTLFRAALNAGLKVTQRRNHAYVVRYYGQPGLDATIYPPYTDLRFLNNTPGYILIQAKIEGTKLSFQFWGTTDGRQVEINGPVVYSRQPDGSAAAYVEQKVSLAGQKIVEETFYSRYKSPNLFPKVLAANRENE